MTLFLCGLWPYLAGGLVGWLLAGWFARKLKHTESPAEKVVDNPQHLSLITKLKSENKKIPDLMSRLSLFESGKSSGGEKGKVIEVDNPVLLARIKELEAASGKVASGGQSGSEIVGGAQAKEKIVEIDNPKLLAEIKMLKGKLQAFDQSSKTNVSSIASSKTSSASASTGQSKPTGQSKSSGLNFDLAKAAGFKIKRANGRDDFTIIHGIGPKIGGLIHTAGIHTYDDLGQTLVEDIQKILDKAGPKYKLAKPGTWPAQSDMAGDNRWNDLKKWQEELERGEK